MVLTTTLIESSSLIWLSRSCCRCLSSMYIRAITYSVKFTDYEIIFMTYVHFDLTVLWLWEEVQFLAQNVLNLLLKCISLNSVWDCCIQPFLYCKFLKQTLSLCSNKHPSVFPDPHLYDSLRQDYKNKQKTQSSFRKDQGCSGIQRGGSYDGKFFFPVPNLL